MLHVICYVVAAVLNLVWLLLGDELHLTHQLAVPVLTVAIAGAGAMGKVVMVLFSCIIGIPSFVNVVKTSSPSCPGSTGCSVTGSMISGKKWSSQRWVPFWHSHSPPTPGPLISVSP